MQLPVSGYEKDKMMQSNNDVARVYVRKIRRTALYTGTVIGVALVYLLSNSVGYGFIAGAGISIMNFQLMAVDAFQITGKSSGKARRFIIGRYFIRYALMAGFIILIVTRTEFNIFSAFAGLFFIQMIIVFGQLFQAAQSVLKTSRG